MSEKKTIATMSWYPASDPLRLKTPMLWMKLTVKFFSVENSNFVNKYMFLRLSSTYLQLQHELFYRGPRNILHIYSER